MVNLISIELINQERVTIQNPTNDELLAIDFWMSGKGNKPFYSVRFKNKTEYINRDYVIRVMKYRE